MRYDVSRGLAVTATTAPTWHKLLSRPLPATPVPLDHNAAATYWGLPLPRTRSWTEAPTAEDMWMAVLSVPDRVPDMSGAGLRALRKVARISQVELADALAVTQGYVSRWESEGGPRWHLVPAVLVAVHCLILGIPLLFRPVAVRGRRDHSPAERDETLDAELARLGMTPDQVAVHLYERLGLRGGPPNVARWLSRGIPRTRRDAVLDVLRELSTVEASGELVAPPARPRSGGDILTILEEL